MKNTNDAEKLAEDTLKSLDNIESADANDFIFTRIQNRLAAKQQVPVKEKLKLMYTLSAMLLFFIVVNIISFNYLSTNTNAVNTRQKTSGLSAFATDYNLDQNSYNY